MKKVFYTLLIITLASVTSLAQVPQAFKYQAVIRDAGGDVISNQYVSLKISILQDSPDGLPVYSETHAMQTTGLGLVNLNVGQGEHPSTSFSELDWGVGNHYIRIEMDPYGGTDYIQMGTSELLSVPYALYALSSGESGSRGGGNLWKDDKNTDNIYNTNSANVGVGTTSPDELLHVAGTIKIEDGTQGSGKVLSSDANGVASWTDPSGLILETDPVFGASVAGGIVAADITNWNDAYGWGDHSLAGYIDSELDPVFGLSPAFGIANSDITNWNTAFGWGDHAAAGYLTIENDPVFAASPAFGIVALDIINWNLAFSWGDHSLAGYLTSESDPVFGASPAFGIAGADITNWNTAFGWGDHSLVGYLTSESDPVFTASDAFTIGALDIMNWDDAYGWGDHSLEGYLTSENDPVFGASPAFGIAAGDITNWNTAFGWGDHAAAGYLTVENDPVFAASPAFSIVAADLINWNLAFGWGDHSLVGYLTTEVDGSVTNEIQTISRSGLTISLSDGGGSITDSIGEYTAGLGVDITNNVVSVINYDSIAYGSWDRNGADIYFDKGNVGVGTDSPDESFHTTGKVKIEGMTKGNILDSLVTWNPADSTLRVIPASSVGGGGIGVVPDPSIPVPIAFQGDTLWVHPTDNAVSVDFATAVSTCGSLSAFTKDDWYAPSRIELDAIYKQSYLLTGLEQYNEWKYWSSTTSGTDDAFSQRMDYGGPDPDPKTVAVGHRVRCVRKN